MGRLALSLLAAMMFGALADAQSQPEALLDEPQEVIDMRPTVGPDVDPRPPRTGIVVGPTADDILLRLAPAMDDRQVVQQLLALDPAGWGQLPAPAVLILADALTRRGKLGPARQLYDRLLTEGNDDSPWRQGAQAGLGWIAFVQNDREGVRRVYARDSEQGPGTPVARVLLALLDAGDARPGAAGELERLSVAADVPLLLQEVSRIGVAYAYLWTRSYGAARRAFERVTDDRFADDAAYGEAWSRHLEGDDDAARAALRAVAERSRKGTRRRAALRLVQLEPNAVLRSGLDHFHDWHVATGQTWLADMMDLDGVRLAGAALRMLEKTDAGAAPAEEPSRQAATPQTSRSLRAGVRPSVEGAAEGSWTWVVTSALLILFGLLLAARRQWVTWGPASPGVGGAATKRR